MRYSTKFSANCWNIHQWTICFCFLLVVGLFDKTLPAGGSELENDIDVEHQPTTFYNVTATDSNQSEQAHSNQTSRNSRQLFSLLKTILSPQRQTQQNIQKDTQYPNPSQQLPIYQQNPQYQQMQNPYESQYPGGFYPASSSTTSVEQKIHSANINPGYQHEYPMNNYASQQHNSVPVYNDNFQQQQQATQLYQQTVSNSNIGGGGSSNPNPLLALLSSALGAGAGGGSANNAVVSSMLSKLGLGIPEDLDLSGLINFGSIEGMIGRVNRFDKLQCIPRMICQMVAKRNEDARIRDSTTTTTTTTTTTEKSSSKKAKKKSRQDSGRFIKIDGVDTALDQFVKFLDLMQLKDWSLYPYVKGMTEGNQVQTAHQCADKFRSCPFSEDQLVYYFNNYNGGFFQSFRSGRNLPNNSTLHK